MPDPATRYYAETPCEHGEYRSHQQPDSPARISGFPGSGYTCPGGSRIPLTVREVNRAAAFDAAHHIIWVEMDLEFSGDETRDLARRVVDAAIGGSRLLVEVKDET